MKLHQTFRLDSDLIEVAKKYAEKENRTISNVYETAVIEYLRARGQKIKKPSNIQCCVAKRTVAQARRLASHVRGFAGSPPGSGLQLVGKRNGTQR